MHGKKRLYERRSLFLFDGKSKFRYALVWFIEWKVFDHFILFCIFLNSITLATFDYGDRDSLTLRNIVIEKAGVAFNAIFTFECVCKILALGFIVHRRSYLRDGFNIIDFLVVVSGVLELF